LKFVKFLFQNLLTKNEYGGIMKYGLVIFQNLQEVCVIQAKGLTMRYRNGRGISGLSFEVREGEIFGYLGPNGAGKTTTIRNLLGFIKPQSGSCAINGKDCWAAPAEIQKNLGYLPGEIAFFNNMTGTAFLNLISDMRGVKDKKRRNALLEIFEFDPSGGIRKMSKGMKQKLGIVAAFMHDPAVLILDEPTSGLDPLMQNVFLEMLQEEKKRGKTMLMSSHYIDEVDRTCDRVGIIREGALVDVKDIHSLRSVQRKTWRITFGSPEELQTLKRQAAALGYDVTAASRPNTLDITTKGDIDAFIKILGTVAVKNFEAITQSLEQQFMQYYGQETKNECAAF
jgi:ABC-2 type transport system ATP-binding protein